MEINTAPPATPVPAPLSASTPAQVPSVHAAPTLSAAPVHHVQAAPPAQALQAAPPTKTTAPTPAAHPATTAAAVDPHSTEAELGKEVEALWQDHRQAKSSARKTNKQLALIRADLARALHSLKDVLARPGCKGEWSSFLDSHSIARTTADRLVARHQKLVTPPASNCTTGATEESMETVVRRCLDMYWKKLSPMLATPEAVELFIDGLRDRAQESFGADDETLATSEPDDPAETL